MVTLASHRVVSSVNCYRSLCLFGQGAHLVMNFTLGHTYNSGHLLTEHALETLETFEICSLVLTW